MNGVLYFGEYFYGTWRNLCLSIDSATFILPAGTSSKPIPFAASMILPASTTTIQEKAFVGIKDALFLIPAAVTFIADDAFDPSAIVLVDEGSYAEERCRELGLKVFISK